MTKEEKEALAEHYKNKDLYDPSKAPEQETCAFKPQPIQMADGGDVPQETGEDLQNSLSQLGKMDALGVQDSLKDGLADQKPILTAPAASKPPLAAPLAKEQAPIAQTQPIAPQAAPQAQVGGAGKLSQDQYDELVASLKKGPGIGGAAMSGLAGLADAISTGVARTGNPGFQKQIEESRQNQKKNLIEALNAKYGHGLERERMAAENQRSANTIAGENERARLGRDTEMERTRQELAVKEKEAQAGRAQSGIEAAAKLPATGLMHPSTWGLKPEIESVRQQLLSQGLGESPKQGNVRQTQKGHTYTVKP